MDKIYKIGLSVVRTLILLGMGTGTCYRELFLKDDPNYVLISMGWAMIIGEGLITAWILQRFSINGTNTPSSPPQVSSQSSEQQ